MKTTTFYPNGSTVTTVTNDTPDGVPSDIVSFAANHPHPPDWKQYGDIARPPDEPIPTMAEAMMANLGNERHEFATRYPTILAVALANDKLRQELEARLNELGASINRPAYLDELHSCHHP